MTQSCGVGADYRRFASRNKSRVVFCSKVSLRDEFVYLRCLGHLVQHLAFRRPRDRGKFDCACAQHSPWLVHAGIAADCRQLTLSSVRSDLRFSAERLVLSNDLLITLTTRVFAASNVMSSLRTRSRRTSESGKLGVRVAAVAAASRQAGTIRSWSLDPAGQPVILTYSPTSGSTAQRDCCCRWLPPSSRCSSRSGRSGTAGNRSAYPNLRTGSSPQTAFVLRMTRSVSRSVPGAARRGATKGTLTTVLRVALLGITHRHQQVFEGHLLVVLEQVALRR
eukprot:COSAG02_NODE_520_length_20751_cov_17.817112_14_plen_279_part_00